MSLRSLFVDFNSYFASVEQHEVPALRGRPVGVVPVEAETTSLIAASYEAKAHGVGTGTLVSEARRRCPGLVIRLARPERYVAWHHRLLEAIDQAIPIARVGSIDEVACELVGRQCRREEAIALAARVKACVAQAAPGGAIRCSIGIAPNEFLAKTASDMRKPDGLTVIEAGDLPHVLHALQLRDLCGIGAAMEQRLHAHGITTVAQLTAAPQSLLRHAWGSIEGERMWRQLRGVWMPPNPTQRASLGHSHVLGPELRHPAGARAVLKKLLVKAAMRLRRETLLAGALAVRIRHVGHDARWEADLGFDPTDDTRELLRMLTLMIDTDRRRHALLPGPAGAVPLSVSVTLHRLIERRHSTGSLFAQDANAGKVDDVVDRINRKFGLNKVYFASMQKALEHQAAPMRIPFSRIPDSAVENEAGHDALWLQSFNRAKVLAEQTHRSKKTR